MKSTKKYINSIMKGVMAAMPVIPYVMKPRRAPVLSYVLGGIGFAIAGGLVAVMLFSPRTRTRALNAAKNTYGKVNEKISHLPAAMKGHRGEVSPVSNGLAGTSDYSTTTGL